MTPTEALFKYANVRRAKPTLKELLGHAVHHDVKQWLIDGAKREDARTLLEAIKRTSDYDLQKGLALALSKDND
jgi:hypothetical protein